MDSRVGPAFEQVVLVGLSALDSTIGSIAKLLRVCPHPTIDEYVSELAGGGGALVAAATPNALPPGEFMIGPLTDSAAVDPIDPARCLHPARSAPRVDTRTWKALLATYLVGGRGAPRQAITLGVVITFSHTAAVMALVGVLLVAGRYAVPGAVVPVLTIVAGVVVLVLGIRLAWHRWSSARSSDGHGHGHHGRPSCRRACALSRRWGCRQG